MSAFCFVRNPSSSTAPNATPPRQVRARIPTRTAARRKARSRESTLAVSAKAPLTRKVAAQRPAATIAATVLPPARRTINASSTRTARLAAKETSRMVGRSRPVTRARAPVIQKYSGGYGHDTNAVVGGP